MKYKDLSSEHHPKIKLKKKKSDYIARDLATDKNTAKLAWVKSIYFLATTAHPSHRGGNSFYTVPFVSASRS